MKKRILSGMQPTNQLHIGNYIGALKQWIGLQDLPDTECFYCIVDLHAITVPYDPKALKENIYALTAAYLAAGLDPKRVTLFKQSDVVGHTDLAWLLGTITPLGWLNRMTQFKEKAGKKREQASLGLYSYPVLQAADILLYHATHVPVGEDQKQHIELCRDIAMSFNSRFKSELLTSPQPMILKQGARIMSLRDGSKKMSKSDVSDYSRINFNDDADMIAQKIKKAKTDPDLLPGTIALLENRPEAKNLLTLLAVIEDKPLEAILQNWEGKSFSDLKPYLTDVLVAEIAPIAIRMKALNADRAYLDDLLEAGALRASEIANQTLKDVKGLMGF